MTLQEVIKSIELLHTKLKELSNKKEEMSPSIDKQQKDLDELKNIVKRHEEYISSRQSKKTKHL